MTIDQDAEWTEIYRKLVVILAPYGKDDACGEGDYWILDDNWGNPVHKIHVFNPSIVTEELISSIRKVISEYSTDWEVRLIIDAHETLGHHPQMGISIFGSAVVPEIPEQYTKDLPFLANGERRFPP